MESIPEIINGLPNISGWEDWVRQTTARGGTVYLGRTPMRPERIQSAFAVALHMHQPVILYNHDLRTAPMVSNLQYMMENQQMHGNQDAPVFAWCYKRTARTARRRSRARSWPVVVTSPVRGPRASTRTTR